jgi:hypothetical protein
VSKTARGAAAQGKTDSLFYRKCNHGFIHTRTKENDVR